jgi:uncharacterized protein
MNRLSLILAFVCVAAIAGCASVVEVPRQHQATLEAAQRGDAPAQEAIGELFHYGEGVPRDHRLAVQWYRRAADQGLASAQDALGLMYAAGLGVSESCQDAVEWFEKAMAGGYPLARGNLAWMLATCPDARARNGLRALALAKEDLERLGAGARELDNLAAACAETGDFTCAVSAQTRAVALMKQRSAQSDETLEAQIRLERYKAGKPWRGASFDNPEAYKPQPK